jgi:putative transposase
MPRINRGLACDLIYHVINRGNSKKKVFHKDRDFIAFIKLMGEAKELYPLELFAYCLMPNHFHFVLMQHHLKQLSKWMHWLTTAHVRRYHHLYKTTGHIWQGRYKSFIIQDNDHLLTVLRYVEGNPVRAGFVLSARDWIWSSHKNRIGEKYEKLLDNVPIKLPSDWARYVDEPLTAREIEKLRRSVNRQSPFGNVEWMNKISQQLGLEHTLRPRGRPRKKIIINLEKRRQ